MMTRSILAVVAATIVAAPTVLASVVINEVQSSNDLTPVVDDVGEAMDWIELYNNGGETVSLAGWGLSDKVAKNPFKFTFPTGASIAAGEHLVVICDKVAKSKDRYVTGFSLGADGETLTLTDTDTNKVDEITFGMIPCDCSFGRVQDGTELKYFATPTPGAANDRTAYANPLGPVAFSKERGVFTGSTSFEVTLLYTNGEDGVDIYYTTDHSDPTPSSTKYTAPISVSKTTIIRATAVKTGHLPYRNITTHSYLYLDQIVNQQKPSIAPTTWTDLSKDAEDEGTTKQGSCPASYTVSTKSVLTTPEAKEQFLEALGKAPVVSVTLSDADLFDPDNGIYCKPVTLDGKDEGKRSASVEWVTGKHVFCTDAGFCAHGDASRHFDYMPKKSFCLKFRGRYGANKLEEPVMDDIGYTCDEFKSLVLRGESNHSWTHIDGPQYGTSMHDQFLRDVSGAMTGFHSHGNQVHLFLNGLYWGLYNVSEAMDDHFAAAQWGGENEQYDVISGDRHEPTGIEVNDGKADDFNAVANSIRAMSAEVTAKRVDEKTFYEKACAEIDLDRMIDYLILEWYIGNDDWPQKNWKATISKANGVPLTYFAWDLDTSLESTTANRVTADPVKDNGYKSVTNCVQYIQRALEVSAEYKLRFADRVHKHFFGDGALVAENLIARYQTMAERVRPMVFAEVARWGAYRKDYTSGTLYNMDTWDKEYNRLIGTFFPGRWTNFKTQLKNQGLYPSVEAAEFEVAADAKSATLKSAPSGATVYYTTDGSDPREAYTGKASAQAQVCAAGAAVEATGLKPVKARALSSGTWSALTEIDLMPPRNAYATGDNGEDWDNDANWTFGYYPNAPDAEASVGVPTKLKKNATYRNIHINSNDISVAYLAFTNGGKTNRVDTGDNGGGDFNLYGTVTVKDTGAAIIELDAPSAIRLCANVTADVAEGGELILKGALAGDGFNLLKSGAGTLTLACTNAAGEAAIGKLQCDGGVVAVEKPISVGSVTKGGDLWVKIGETAAETNAILTSDGKVNAAVKLFVPATEVGEVWVGGVAAAGEISGGVQVFIPDKNGQTAFDKQNWSPAADASVGQVTVDGKLTFEVTVNSLEPVNNGKLRISEICPKPQMEVAVGYTTVDAPKMTDATDPNGAVAGWIELVNEGTDPVNLAQYELQVFNRGKKASTGKFANLPSRMLASGERVLVYTTKDYCEGGRFSTAFMEEDSTRAFTAGEAAGIVADEIVLSTKVNSKKFPMVRLCRGADVVQTVVVPCDLPDGAAVVATDAEGGATLRYMTKNLTPGAANDLTDAVMLGPNVGPLYGIKHSYSDLDPVPMATSGQAYAITLDVNPVDAENEKDAIASVTLVYRTDVNTTSEASFKTLTMTKGGNDAKGHGQMWTASVPAANLPAKGKLLQWRAKITDAAGNTWTSPAFLDKANGYGWYGTVVDPGVGDGDGQLSATLPTLHLFAETGANNKSGTTTYYLADRPGKNSTTGTYGDNCLMNLDYDETYECLNTTAQNTTKKQNFRKFYPYGARVAIYDSQTSNYYDNVRIDCRGNSSDDYYKRSHGLKFSKIKAYRLAEPYVHPVSGEEIEEVAKTSLCAEYNDPAMFRQRLAFWFMNEAGVPAPWENPKRVNLNGQFYQLAYESPRFGDELLCDIYGFDELGYGYKNVGTFHQVTQFKDDWGFTMGTSGSAGTKRYTPDDGKEKGFEELLALFEELKAAGSLTTDDNAALTKTVAGKFDLPAWINYLAATKITQEGDDAWGNVGAYWDNAKLLDGNIRGTGAWRPLAWDMNCSWGQYYQAHVSVGRNGIMADADWNKCHPLYGGVRILGYKSSSNTTTSNSYYGKDGANYAFEAVFQSTKFRRLFLRRLRTLMDKYLKAQNTSEDDTPIAVQAKAYANEIQAEAVKDRGIWGHLGTTSGNKDCDWVNCWGTTMMSNRGTQPDDPSYGYIDIWQNYIVPRRVHLYTTHSIDNTTKGVGYALAKSAGIPPAQSAFLDLRDQITIRADEATGSVVIENANAEAVDISGWKVSGPVEMTLPPGTVVDQKNGRTPGQVFVTADRRATIAAMTLTDQVVVGNGEAGEASATPRLVTDTDEKVYPLTVHYTISYDSNGGEGEIEPGAAETENEFETAECTFTKAGKVCTGWGTNGVDGLVFVCEPGEKVTNLAIEDGAEVTLYAMWEPKMPVPDDPAEVTTNLTLSVGETVVFTNRYRKNLRFWLLGLDGAGECVEAALNIPTNACEQYRGYVARSTFKTNEVIVTITGKVKGEESIFLGRQYKSKEPRCMARYTVIVE